MNFLVCLVSLCGFLYFVTRNFLLWKWLETFCCGRHFPSKTINHKAARHVWYSYTYISIKVVTSIHQSLVSIYIYIYIICVCSYNSSAYANWYNVWNQHSRSPCGNPLAQYGIKTWVKGICLNHNKLHL